MKNSTLFHIVRLMRPRQWLKNTSLFAGIFFAEKFFNLEELIKVSEGFIIFKNVIIVDALIVAFGFVIRVFAGALAISINISSWLVLATIGLALLLAFGKRKSERTLVVGTLSSGAIETRPILNRYPESLLDSMISTSASFTMITYSLF